MVARQALDDLFQTRGNNDVLSISDSDHIHSESDLELYRSNNPPSTTNDVIRPSTSGILNSNEVRDTYKVENKLSSTEKPRRLGSVSVLSDCSVGSFATESTSNADYGRLKSELRQLQRECKV